MNWQKIWAVNKYWVVDCKINPTLFGKKRSAPKNGIVINTILKEAGLFCPNTGQTILGPMIFGVDR